VAKNGEGVTIVSVEAVLSAEPKQALMVLRDGVNDVVGEAIGGGEVEKARLRRLGVCGCRQQQTAQDSKNKEGPPVHSENCYW